jgi:hypothetical protein
LETLGEDERKNGEAGKNPLSVEAYVPSLPNNPFNFSPGNKSKPLFTLGEKDRSGGSSFPLSSSIDGKSKDQCDYVEKLVVQYFNVIRSQIVDFIPKCIMYHLYECSVEGQIKIGIVSILGTYQH